jgi:hypothetical protein
MYVSITPSTRKDKKYMAVFYDNDKKKVKTVQFGAKGYQDYTDHHDEMRKTYYLNRHRKNENWDDYMTAGSLSRYILWENKSFDTAVKEYMKKFGLKEYN